MYIVQQQTDSTDTAVVPHLATTTNNVDHVITGATSARGQVREANCATEYAERARQQITVQGGKVKPYPVFYRMTSAVRTRVTTTKQLVLLAIENMH